MKPSLTIAAQVVACLGCAVCALMPLVERTKAYWGYYGASVNHAPPRLHQVLEGSPAARDGLKVGDVVLTADGSPPLDLPGLDEVLLGLRPGGSVVLHVRRGERELDVTARGVVPEIATIYYPHETVPITGGVCLALGLVILGTGPLRPVPIWRPCVTMVVGLGAAVVFFFVLAIFHPWAALTLRQFWPRRGVAPYGLALGAVGLASSLLLAALGAWELRTALARKATPEGTNPPLS